MPIPIAYDNSTTADALATKLASVANPAVAAPVWKGPFRLPYGHASVAGYQGGITQSLVARWLTCPERFRILTVEGLKASESWNHRIGYGNFWHLAEETHLAGKDWRKAVTDVAREECRAYPMDQATVEHWWAVCVTQFPVYLDWWARHPETATRKSLLQEYEFKVPYKLPSSRTVILRGKWDSVDVLTELQTNTKGLWITDHKTKSDIDAQMIVRQLQRDLQTMFYVVAYEHGGNAAISSLPLRGVRYNCVRRPLSGGRGTIRQHQPTKKNPEGESREAFYARVGEVIRTEPDYYFQRFQCEVVRDDIDRFRRECLDPILENICNDWEWWSYCRTNSISPFDGKARYDTFGGRHYRRHYIMPFGVYSPLNEGRATDLDNYLATGSEAGLTRVTNLFPELKGCDDARQNSGNGAGVQSNQRPTP
jgi:hypothetical protein